MKICVISYNHPPLLGGIETYSNYLKKYLGFYKKEHKYITGNFSKIKIFIIIQVVIKAYIHLLRNKNYKIIHLTNINLWPILYISKIFKNQIFIVNLHGLELIYGNRKKILSKIYEFLIPYTFINKNRNIYFLCNSLETKELAKLKFRDSQLFYLPMGIEKIIKSNEVDVNVNQFFFIGRIVERKGLAWFCENVLCHFPAVKLFFAGPIIDKHEFKKINNYSQTEYLGVIDDKLKNKYIKNSFVTVMPNLINSNDFDFEGFGISFLEVLANNGLPIVTKTQGINTSSLNGTINVTIDSNSPIDWINKINELQTKGLKNRKNLIASSQKLIEENFLWINIFKNTFLLYEKLSKD
tara:strand:- start:98 stop:1156 length:1059 start_codon:yes stop_codon:yes gene_type:complete